MEMQGGGKAKTTLLHAAFLGDLQHTIFKISSFVLIYGKGARCYHTDNHPFL